MAPTQLATTSAAAVPSVFDQITDPLAFINEMGKVFAHAGVCGTKTEAQGKVLVLACICERCHPFEIDRRYHLIDGRASKKPVVMLEEFCLQGGTFDWVNDGSDGKQASLQLNLNGKSITSNFSIADAERAGYVRPGSGWVKTPSNMLRARCISNGMPMIAPWISAGMHTPEEILDQQAEEPPKPQRTQAAAQSRAEELRQMAEDTTEVHAAKESPSGQEGPSASAAPQEAETATDADEQDSSAEAVSVEKDAATSAAPVAGDMELIELDLLIREMGMTNEQFERAVRKNNPQFPGLEKITKEQAARLTANIRAKLEAAKAGN